MDAVERLKELKKNGELGVKKYLSPIPNENIMEFGVLLVTYVTEETPLGPQRTLGISHVNGRTFEINDYKKGLINEVFNIEDCPLKLEQSFNQRGRTKMYVWKQ